MNAESSLLLIFFTSELGWDKAENLEVVHKIYKQYTGNIQVA